MTLPPNQVFGSPDFVPVLGTRLGGGMTFEFARHELAMPNIWKAYIWAIGLHGMLLIWNPTVITGGTAMIPPALMQVQFLDKLPAIAKPPAPPPVAKKPAHKINKRQLAHHTSRAVPVRTRTHRVAKHHTLKAPVPPAHPIHHDLPKFIPHEAPDDILMSQAHPSQAVSVPAHTRANPFPHAPRLKSKSRGVQIQDVKFELSEPGALSEKSGAGRVVNIPLGEERGDVASIATAPMLHSAPGDGQHPLTTHYRPGGTGGELVNRKHTGMSAHIDVDVSGPSDTVVADAARGNSISASGSGFEIGGPVGDRKILRKHLPEYPAWAEDKGVSAMVKIWFTVRPDGRISTSMRIVASSGYPELDSLAKEALRQWQFSATSHDASQEAWGVITFRFTLA